MSMVHRRTVLLAGLLLAPLTRAVAQSPGGPGWRGVPGGGPGMAPGMGPGMGMGMGSGMGMMGGGPDGLLNQDAYLDTLKGQLRISEAQAPAWAAYVDAVKGVAGQMQGVRQSMWVSMQTADWQERRDMMNNMFQARQQGFDTIHQAALHLLPALGPEQQAHARYWLPGLLSGRGWMPGGH